MKARRTPAQKPNRSEQVVGTPREFLDAVEQRFGPILWDLAANAENSVRGDRFYGPGSLRGGENSLELSWACLGGLLWLNPPFGNIAPWAKKCAQAREHGARIALLVPASVGSRWFNEHVRPHAYVLELAPRVKFIGHRTGYPKDLMLCMFTPEGYVGRASWRWKP